MFRTILLLLFSVALSGLSQEEQPSPTPPSNNNQGAQRFTREQLEEMTTRLHERVAHAADQVIGRIQQQESDIRIKYGYFRKPERLDPNSFATRDEISQWRQSLQDLKAKQDVLDKLYSNADQDLESALLDQKINPAVVDQVKRELIQSFPWDTIKDKNQRMQEFIVEQGHLLDFYEKHWGSWTPNATSGEIKFNDDAVGSAFAVLTAKIDAIGQQIDTEYQAMVQ